MISISETLIPPATATKMMLISGHLNSNSNTYFNNIQLVQRYIRRWLPIFGKFKWNCETAQFINCGNINTLYLTEIYKKCTSCQVGLSEQEQHSGNGTLLPLSALFFWLQ
jgi:hypothetical protein